MITVYKHTSPSGNTYIGITKFDMEERLRQHIKSAKANCEYMFHKAIRKYGIENFKSEILEICETLEIANEREKYYISLYDTYNNGYNMTEGGYGRPPGWKHTEETKQKLALLKIGSTPWNKGVAVGYTWNKGIKLSEEQKKNMGHPHTDESKQKLSEFRIGTKQSEETKLKISEAVTGENNPMFGNIHSDETKEKMKNSQIGRIWIKNILLNEAKRIYHNELEEYILNGWTKGMLKNNQAVKITKIWVNNTELNKSTLIRPNELEEYILNGWDKGMLKK